MTTPVPLDYLQIRVGQTAAWRRNLADKFPDDPRNVRAAERLEQLAKADCSAIPPDVTEALRPYLTTAAFRDIVSEISRDVEFRCRPKSFDDFLKLVSQKLAAATRH